MAYRDAHASIKWLNTSTTVEEHHEVTDHGVDAEEPDDPHADGAVCGAGEGSSGAAHTDDARSNTRHTPEIKDRISLHENVRIEFWHTPTGPATTLPQ